MSWRRRHASSVAVVVVAAAAVAIALPGSPAGGAPAGSDGRADAGAVSVSGPSANGEGRCPPVRVLGPERVKGGCVAEAGGSYLQLDVKTMLGGFEFSSCFLNFYLHVDGSGRFVTQDVKFNGRSPCNDAAGCSTDEATIPWRGRFVRTAGGKLEARIDMCLDTCLGRFEGPLVLGVRPTATGWRLRADQAPVGMSGWEFDGHLDIREKDLRID